jgi:flavin reductase (DIM6/NTAB) family NADH-FMN oxidoreductase RutF
MKIDPKNLSWKDAHELLLSAIVPRPIAFVSTIGPDGVYNLAPFSLFAPVSIQPALVGIGIGWKRDGSKKDTLVNIESSKDFVVNLVTDDLTEAMNESSRNFPSEVDEFKETGLTSVKSDLIKSPRVGESAVSLECQLNQILEFGQLPRRNSFVIGEVVRVHVRDGLWAHDVVKTPNLKVIARMGEELYCRTTDIFEMKKPEDF